MKIKRKILILSCLAMLIAISVTSVSYAGEDHPVTDALKQYMESVTESDVQVSFEGELATFTIYSEGTGETTWQDIACMKRAFDSVRQDSVKEAINSIRVTIIDSQGEVIYDAQDNYINYPPNGEYILRDESPEASLQEEPLLNSDNEADEADEASSMEREPVEFSDTVVVENDVTSEEIEDKLNDIENELMLQAADDTCDSPQSEITIENQDGEVVGYYAADHENGVYFSWSAKP